MPSINAELVERINEKCGVRCESWDNVEAASAPFRINTGDIPWINKQIEEIVAKLNSPGNKFKKSELQHVEAVNEKVEAINAECGEMEELIGGEGEGVSFEERVI